MLVANLFTVLESNFNGQQLNAKVEINPENRLFEGHFPDNPVTPGVIQLQLVKELLEQELNRELEVLTMSRVKFLAILNPNEVPVLDVVIDIKQTEEGQVDVKAAGSANGVSFFKFYASYS